MFNFELPDEMKWVDISSPEFNRSLQELITTNNNMLIMGPGGTGKSLLLELTYRYFKETNNIIILAPTGIASANLSLKGVPASTIHSAFSIAPGDLYEEVVDMNSNQIEVIKKVDTIIIDEISMCPPALLDQMLWLIKEIRPLNWQDIRFILFGDVLQLSPVVNLNEDIVYDYYKYNYNLVAEFFASKFYRYLESNIKICILDKIYRQSDTSFKNILNRMRKGIVLNEDLDILNSKVINPSTYIKSHEVMMYLASTNKRVNELNNVYNQSFNGKPYKLFRSVSEGTFKCAPEDEMIIYKGQQVMCTANNKSAGYQNGTLGIVVGFTFNGVIIKKSTGELAEVVPNTIVDHRFVYDYVKKKVKIERPGSYTMIACRPAFACTIHKSQGLTLDNAYIDLSSWVPMSGTYLALSRLTSIDGLGLIRPLVKSDIIVNKVALNFYNKCCENKIN